MKIRITSQLYRTTFDKTLPTLGKNFQTFVLYALSHCQFSALETFLFQVHTEFASNYVTNTSFANRKVHVVYVDIVKSPYDRYPFNPF